MKINATSNGTQRELIPAGNYIARCYQMLHIGTVQEMFQGELKTLNKVRIGWELPDEQRVFKEEKGLQPCVISKEYTLSMHEKANLRKMLASWRGSDFSQKEAESFDITKLIGVPCMLNIIHKPSAKDPTKIYEEIGSVSPLPKKMVCPPQINKTSVLAYDDFNEELFNSLPDFLKTKIQSSAEYKAMKDPHSKEVVDHPHQESIVDDLPF